MHAEAGTWSTAPAHTPFHVKPCIEGNPAILITLDRWAPTGGPARHRQITSAPPSGADRSPQRLLMDAPGRHAQSGDARPPATGREAGAGRRHSPHAPFHVKRSPRRKNSPLHIARESRAVPDQEIPREHRNSAPAVVRAVYACRVCATSPVVLRRSPWGRRASRQPRMVGHRPVRSTRAAWPFEIMVLHGRRSREQHLGHAGARSAQRPIRSTWSVAVQGAAKRRGFAPPGRHLQPLEVEAVHTDRTCHIIARRLPPGAFFDHAARTTAVFASAGLVGIFPAIGCNFPLRKRRLTHDHRKHATFEAC